MKTTTLFAIVGSFFMAPAGQLLTAYDHTVIRAGLTASTISSGKEVHPFARLLQEMIQIDTGFITHTHNEKIQTTAKGNKGIATQQKQQVAADTLRATNKITDPAKSLELQQAGAIMYILVSGVKEQQLVLKEQQQTIGQQQNRIRSLENEIKQLKDAVSKLISSGSQ